MLIFGFADEQATEPEKKIVINAGEFAVSPPQYWHKVELSKDAQFHINFWAENIDEKGELMNQSQAHKDGANKDKAHKNEIYKDKIHNQDIDLS